jgi:glycosyltransferase involved in cell wall biosynthesis
VWILPTERENFSVAVLEALAAERAVLSTSCPGNDEILIDGSNAAVFAVGDIAGGTAQLRTLLADEALRARLGMAGAVTAGQHTTERMVEGYRRLYLHGEHVPPRLRVEL